MARIKGPGILLAHFLRSEAPFDTLESIGRWAAGLGYVGELGGAGHRPRRSLPVEALRPTRVPHTRWGRPRRLSGSRSARR